MKILTAPSGGLGHRIQCIDASIELANLLNAKLTILWFANEQLNCRFDSLFTPMPGDIEIIETSSWKEMTEIQATFDPTLEFDGPFLNAEKPSYAYWSQRDFDPSERILIKCWHRFLATKRGKTHFVPNPEIQIRLDENAHLARGAIGVHIRRTDHNHCIEHSLTEDFFLVLDGRPEDERIFLCTDSDEEEESMRVRYGDRVSIYPKTSRDRNDPEAIKDALMDMFLLSKTNWILGSKGSIYSTCAAYLGNILLHPVSK